MLVRISLTRGAKSATIYTEWITTKFVTVLRRRIERTTVTHTKWDFRI